MRQLWLGDIQLLGGGSQAENLSLLSSTKVIQGVNYKHSPSLKFKLPFLPSYEDFGDDTKPESIYYQLLVALESAEKALDNNITLMLGNCKMYLILLCKRMLARSVNLSRPYSSTWILPTNSSTPRLGTKRKLGNWSPSACLRFLLWSSKLASS